MRMVRVAGYQHQQYHQWYQQLEAAPPALGHIPTTSRTSDSNYINAVRLFIVKWILRLVSIFNNRFHYLPEKASSFQVTTWQTVPYDISKCEITTWSKAHNNWVQKYLLIFFPSILAGTVPYYTERPMKELAKYRILFTNYRSPPEWKSLWIQVEYWGVVSFKHSTDTETIF